ncbi:hypothetical protein Hdeb2414_s0008g00296301 [Helianthus debilis subsp. tardiflorus]
MRALCEMRAIFWHHVNASHQLLRLLIHVKLCFLFGFMIYYKCMFLVLQVYRDNHKHYGFGRMFVMSVDVYDFKGKFFQVSIHSM